MADAEPHLHHSLHRCSVNEPIAEPTLTSDRTPPSQEPASP